MLPKLTLQPAPEDLFAIFFSQYGVALVEISQEPCVKIPTVLVS